MSHSTAPVFAGHRIAVLVPCYNEEAAVGKVVADFRRALPDAVVYVYDNNSKDRTAEVARAAGATVRHEPMKGKGNVVRRMFADIDADVYVLVDGDDTYDASRAPELVQRLVDENLDMLNGAREAALGVHRLGHRFGNILLTGIVRTLFGDRFRDMLSGYRVFSRRYVKSFPALAAGFEIETEMTIHALELNMPTAEVMTTLAHRPEGSVSKLNTFRDGFRILWTITVLLKQERPVLFFGAFALLFALCGLILAVPIIETYVQTGLVPRLPTAVLSMGCMILSCLSVTCGLILESVTRARKELKRLFYLSLPAPKK